MTYAFNRADRPPPWHHSDDRSLDWAYPVQVVKNPVALRSLVLEARRHEQYGRQFGVFETEVDGVPYQVVVTLFYGGTPLNGLFGLAGFTVNLDWVREFYFDELVQQLAEIGGEAEATSLVIADDASAVVTASRPLQRPVATAERQFPLVFVDRALLPVAAVDGVRFRTWTSLASSDTPVGAGAPAGARLFILISFVALAGVVGLVVSVRGVRTAAELAAMKSEFVSSVTHELKTPLAVIRLIADTLARGRYSSEETVREYATLLSRESSNLTRLVDNLLAYARLSDLKHEHANSYC